MKRTYRDPSQSTTTEGVIAWIILPAFLWTLIIYTTRHFLLGVP